MVTPNFYRPAWWLKDHYTGHQPEQLIDWGLEHSRVQNHRMADFVIRGSYRIMVRGDESYIYGIHSTTGTLMA